MGRADLEEALAAGGGVLASSQHRKLRGAIGRAVADGTVVRLLPGVCVATSAQADPLTRCRAVMAWDPGAVLVGAAAARLSFWPEAPVPQVEFASLRARLPAPNPRFASLRRRVPVDLVAEEDGLRWTKAALTTLDLCPTLGGDVIDRCLRSGAASLAELRQALEQTPGRVGNPVRAALLHDSRDEPWSEPERLFHRLLRSAGLTGWRANHRVCCRGRVCFLDVAFPEVGLAIEIDGWQFHASREAFEEDRGRQNLLVRDGWRVLRFTWRMLQDHPADVIAAVAELLGVPEPPPDRPTSSDGPAATGFR